MRRRLLVLQKAPFQIFDRALTTLPDYISMRSYDLPLAKYINQTIITTRYILVFSQLSCILPMQCNSNDRESEKTVHLENLILYQPFYCTLFGTDWFLFDFGKHFSFHISTGRSSHQRCSIKKAALKNLVNFSKHLF